MIDNNKEKPHTDSGECNGSGANRQNYKCKREGTDSNEHINMIILFY